MAKILTHEQLLNATQSNKGIARFATEQETIDALVNSIIVSPVTLKAAIENRVATETIAGIIEIATEEETLAGIDASRAITPATLKSITDTLVSLTSPNFSGTPTILTNLIWHAGNDGSDSGLDSDMVDGKHLSDINNNAIVYALIFG